MRATARLTHWNTIQIYDFGQSADGAFYYVMELLQGGNLGEIVRRCGPLPPERVVHFLRQTCGALAEAHAAGLVHRDIKPENIFAARIGGVYDVAKLLDFGVVHETDERPDARLTAQGTIVGRSLYMSPEQATAAADIGPAADLYCLGAVAYFLLTGQPPFLHENPAEVRIAHVRDQPVPPSRLVPELPSRSRRDRAALPGQAARGPFLICESPRANARGMQLCRSVDARAGHGLVARNGKHAIASPCFAGQHEALK